MAETVQLADYKPPVTYTVRLRHYHDGRIAVWVQDVQDDPESRKSVAYGTVTFPVPNRDGLGYPDAAAEVVRRVGRMVHPPNRKKQFILVLELAAYLDEG